MREGAAGALVSYVERPSERSYRTSRGRWSARIVRREAVGHKTTTLRRVSFAPLDEC